MKNTIKYTVGLLFLTGCSLLYMDGVRLDKTPIASVSAILPQGPAIAPGQKLPLVVIVTEPDGTVLRTDGSGGSPVSWHDLRIKATLVAVDENGIVSLRKDPRLSEGQTGEITITVPSHPGIEAHLDVPVRYNFAFVCDFSGAGGLPGLNGGNGIDGVPGTDGRDDPNHIVSGGNGQSGSDGEDGRDGQPGGDAPSVEIRITVGRPNQLLQVQVLAEKKVRRYLIDPDGGSLTVEADGGLGGPGGSGGQGGRGGRGGKGGGYMNNGIPGADGANGRDGSPGPQGKGGQITLIYDTAAKPYLGLIHLSSQNGPDPIILEQSYPH